MQAAFGLGERFLWTIGVLVIFLFMQTIPAGGRVQAALLCVMRLMRQFVVRRQPAPSPVGEGWGEGFLGCLPILVRAETRKSGYGGDTPCSAFEVSVPVRGGPLMQEGGRGYCVR